MLSFRTKEDEEAALLPAAADASCLVEVLFFVVSVTTIAPAAALLGSVATITNAYSETAYIYVVGFVFISALPMTYIQYIADETWDAQYGRRTAAAFRLSTSCIVQIGACVLLGLSGGSWPNYATLYGCAFVNGFGAWTANGTLNAIAARVGGHTSVAQGLGMQVAFLASFFVVYLGAGSSAFLYGAMAPALGLLCAFLLLSDGEVVVSLETASAPSRREQGPRPALANLCGIEFFAMACSVMATAAMTRYSDYTLWGASLSSALYVSFNSGNVLSRGVVYCVAIPSENALIGGCALRTLLLPGAFFASALPESFDAYIALGFCLYATVGGVLIQDAMLLVRRLDDAVAAARAVGLAQGAGLTIGGLVCCGGALAYDYS